MTDADADRGTDSMYFCRRFTVSTDDGRRTESWYFCRRFTDADSMHEHATCGYILVLMTMAHQVGQLPHFQLL